MVLIEFSYITFDIKILSVYFPLEYDELFYLSFHPDQVS